MLSAVHPFTAALPVSLKPEQSPNASRDGDGEAVDAIPQTPCPSDPEPGHGDPIVMLSRPVEGFHHPRQHFFTDRLIGRFYEDSSLDAETRKTNKCLAGRARSTSKSANHPTHAANGTASPLSSSHTVVTCPGRNRTRLQGNSSVGSSLPGGRGRRVHLPKPFSSKREQQLEKEIEEEHIQIKKLEEKLASLGSRRHLKGDPHGPPSGRGPTTQRSLNPSQVFDQAERSLVEARVNEENRDLKENRQSDSARRKALAHEVDIDEGLRGGSCSLDGQGMRISGESPCPCSGEEKVVVQEYSKDAGPKPSDVTNQDSSNGSRRQTHPSVMLRSTREDFECHLQEVIAIAESQAAETTTNSRLATEDAEIAIKSGARADVATAASTLLRLSRARVLSEPSSNVVQSMRQLLGKIQNAFVIKATFSTKSIQKEPEASGKCWITAKIILDDIIKVLGITCLHDEVSDCASPRGSIEQHTTGHPAGSGRAAAFAAGSSKRGILMSPQRQSHDCHLNSDSPRGRNECTVPRKEECHRQDEIRGDDRKGPVPPRRVPLNALGAEDISRVLKAKGMQEHASVFLTQSVDGEMLSDPDLCETDFLELGLGGTNGCEEATNRPGAASLLQFFKQCQQEGVDLQHDPESASLGKPLTPGDSPRYVRRGRTSEEVANEQDGEDFEICSSDTKKGTTGETIVGNDTVRGNHPGHKLPTKVDEKQPLQIVVDMPFEISEKSEPRDAMSTKGSRRMSISLNRQIIVTTNGRDPDLLSHMKSVENVGDDTKGAAAEELVNSNSSSTTVEPRGNGSHDRRVSLSVPAVVLDTEHDESRDQGIILQPT